MKKFTIKPKIIATMSPRMLPFKYTTNIVATSSASLPMNSATATLFILILFWKKATSNWSRRFRKIENEATITPSLIIKEYGKSQIMALAAIINTRAEKNRKVKILLKNFSSPYSLLLSSLTVTT